VQSRAVRRTSSSTHAEPTSCRRACPRADRCGTAESARSDFRAYLRAGRAHQEEADRCSRHAATATQAASGGPASTSAHHLASCSTADWRYTGAEACVASSFFGVAVCAAQQRPEPCPDPTRGALGCASECASSSTHADHSTSVGSQCASSEHITDVSIECASSEHSTSVGIECASSERSTSVGNECASPSTRAGQ
jgi:hypothetical protein